MSDAMMFPKTVYEFMEQYKIVDSDEVYTNGAELVPIFRMKQWFEHVDAEPIRHGHWIRNDNGTYSCSECHSWVPNEQHYYARYCLFCGAKMDLPEPIIYPQVEGITPTVVKMDEVEE